MNLRRVRSVATGVAGTPWYSNMYFTWVTGTAQAHVDLVRDFWTNCAASLDNSVTWTIEGDCAVVDDATNTIVGIDSVTSRTVTGSSSTSALPPATQALLNTLTGTFIGGRQLRGKVFVPGWVTSVSDGLGAPNASLRTLLVTQGGVLISGSSSPGPWRVLSKQYGTSAVINAVSSPSKFAVMRSRRD